MGDEVERILKLVADGHLTPDEAAPIIEALTSARRQSVADQLATAYSRVNEARERLGAVGQSVTGRTARRLRIRITEHGRQVVNLNIPLGFVDAALGAVPGISAEQGARIQAAIRAGQICPILDIEDEDGDAVLI